MALSKAQLDAERAFIQRQRHALQVQCNFDANETAFLERELEVLRSKIITIDYPDLKAKLFFPMATDIPQGTKTFVWSVEDKVGRAKVAASGVDDIPRVELLATERTGKVKKTVMGYGWDIDELVVAARLGKPVQQRKALAAAEAVARLHEGLFANGRDPSLPAIDYGLPGVLNNADVADGAGAANSRVVALTAWVLGTTTGQDIVDDLNKLAVAIPNGSLQTAYGDTMLLPPEQYNIAAQTRMNDFDSRTALQAFLAASPWIKNVDWWNALTGAAVNPAKNRAMVYKRDPSVVELIEPVAYQVVPPQARNLEMVVPGFGECGGGLIYKPLWVVYGDFA